MGRLGAGSRVGSAMALASASMALAVTARVVSAARRSTYLGLVSAAGSVGALTAAPIGQFLTTEEGWRIGAAGFAAMALIMIPAAWLAGRVDRSPEPVASGSADTPQIGRASGRERVWQSV